MKISATFRYFVALLMLVCLLGPTATLAFGDGKKFFKKGLKHEIAEEWDEAVEDFAVAVADNPKNPEYRLHYIRALFNASQMFMKKARLLADEKDFAGAYVAYRKAYGYDPVNELAKSEMARMLRMQKAVMDGKDPDKVDSDVKLVKTGLDRPAVPDDVAVPQRYEKLRDVPFPSGVDLQFLIRELAKDLDLNVLFDTNSFRSPKRIKIELKNVTAAKALDYIFLQEGLFFEKVGPRTIIVAASTRRQFFQQLVLRTFYLANADPKDVAAIIQKAIPAQPGRTPTIVLTDEDTNSITIRDTAENIRLMEQLISSLDKDRAEVVMDVKIFEVSKTDLLEIGNQVGDQSRLSTLGGLNRAVIGRTLFPIWDIGVAIPSSSIAAFQRKDTTKLLASTQIHAFNNEDSSARIGQRVPVQTASVSSFNNSTQGQTNNNIFGTGFPVINYEQIGLTLKFKPIVFPNQDVQVAMEIESKDVVNRSSLTPTFTERTIKGTARVQNNKTLLLASVAQDNQSKGREGIPWLGWIPVLGRLFTAPTRDNSQVDIVIAVTPRVIRAPAILPEDVIERPTGSLAVPTSGSLDALLIREEIERQQALARKLPSKVEIQLPDRKAPTYVKSTGADNSAKTANQKPDGDASAKKEEVTKSDSLPVTKTDEGIIKPIESTNRTIDLARTLKVGASADEQVNLKETSAPDKADESPKEQVKSATLPIADNEDAEMADSTGPSAALSILPKVPEMEVGDSLKLAVIVRSAEPFRSAVLGFSFDETAVKIKSVSFGDVFGPTLAHTEATPFFNQNGKLYVSLSSVTDVAANSSGVLGFIEIEALRDGFPQLEFDPEILNMLTATGGNFRVTVE
ncbi:MAG: hypothetical protein HKN33_16865 [Pyrinomonadaceae bacterium]|nr:hypothetical protein [Pyrinomonadaceae bacterium]